MELASRDVVSRAEQTEINEGRGFPDGTVALDITVVPKKRVHEALREIVLVGRDFAGVDITREPIHIKPGNHYTMGGVKTDVDGRTDIPGLYAAGETACVSVHGGNRLGANSLLDTLIFGRRSGADAAARAKRTEGSRPSPRCSRTSRRRSPTIAAREKGSGRRVSEIKLELGTDDGRQGRRLPRRGRHPGGAGDRAPPQGGGRRPPTSTTRAAIFNQDLLGAIELGYMLDNAECTCVAALERKESRGAQYRTDFPERNDEEWLKHIDLQLSDDGPEISYSEVTITQWEPRREDLLDGRVHAESPPVPARERRGRLLGGVQGRPRSLALGPRRPAAGQGPRRRLALGPLLLPRRDLRLLRDEDQRPVRPRLQDPDRRGPGAGRQEGKRRRRRRRGHTRS